MRAFLYYCWPREAWSCCEIGGRNCGVSGCVKGRTAPCRVGWPGRVQPPLRQPDAYVAVVQADRKVPEHARQFRLYLGEDQPDLVRPIIVAFCETLVRANRRHDPAGDARQVDCRVATEPNAPLVRRSGAPERRHRTRPPLFRLEWRYRQGSPTSRTRPAELRAYRTVNIPLRRSRLALEEAFRFTAGNVVGILCR